MHGINPAPVNRRGFISQQGLMKVANAAMQFGLSGGPNDTVSSQGITAKPQLLDACFAIVDDYEDNRHAWTEADVSDPDNVRRMVGGRRGTIEASGSGRDDQTAWGLNGDFYNIDDVIYIVRINYNAWGIVGGLADGEGSNGAVPAYCDGVLTGYITISGDDVSVRYVSADGDTGGGETDSDVAAYFAANTELTDVDHKAAIEACIVGLKADSLWTKIGAFYPHYGTTSAGQKWNAKNPADTAGAFRLTYTGGITLDANGLTGDGSTGYVNTHWAPTDFAGADSGAIAIYNRTDSASGANPYDSGRSDGSDTQFTGLICEYSNGNAYGAFGTATYNCNVSAGTSTGLWIMNRNSTTNTELWHSGTLVKDIADTVTLGTGIPIYLCASNKNGTATYFSNKNQGCTLIFVSGLTSTDVANLTSRINTLMTALGR